MSHFDVSYPRMGHADLTLFRYYVLIATCLLARKVERLVNAFLAVGLILPAVAPLHGIVLAALHKEGGPSFDDRTNKANSSQVPSTWTSTGRFNCALSAFWRLQ